MDRAQLWCPVPFAGNAHLATKRERRAWTCKACRIFKFLHKALDVAKGFCDGLDRGGEVYQIATYVFIAVVASLPKRFGIHREFGFARE